MQQEIKSNTFLNVNLTIISLVIVFYILYIGASFIIPFVIALLLAFALISTHTFFKKYLKNSFISFILTIILYLLIFWIISKIINTNIQSIVEKSSFYQDQLRFIIDKTVAKFGIKEGEFYQKMWGYIDLPMLFSNMATLVTNIISYLGIITFYLIFIVLEYKFFTKKLNMIMKDSVNKSKILDIIHEVKQDIKTYFFIKTFVSFLTGFLAYILMKLIGLDFALFWAFLVFLLNFIPNVGSIIAGFFPVVFSLVQFNDYYHFFIVLGGIIFINTLVGNFIEPILTGNKLNLSPLVTLISLVFWGSIWGIPGMFLSVPIMFIISIVFSKFDETKGIAILLSEKGDIKGDIEAVFTKQKSEILQKMKRIFMNIKK
nr:AI-2E family transporter [Candidatus Gracilibacteria bacterium]